MVGGGAEKFDCEAAPPLARSADSGIALMGSLQISTGSTLGKVVNAVGLWTQTSLTHRKSACRVCSYVCADLLSIYEGSLSKEGFHGTHGIPSRSATVSLGQLN